MATPEDIAMARQYIAEPTPDNGWDDERIGLYVDGSDNLLLAAADMWGVKAGEAATLVNVSESGSSRSLSDLLRQAREMESYYRARGEALYAPDPNGGPVIARIRRGK